MYLLCTPSCSPVSIHGTNRPPEQFFGLFSSLSQFPLRQTINPRIPIPAVYMAGNHYIPVLLSFNLELKPRVTGA